MSKDDPQRTEYLKTLHETNSKTIQMLESFSPQEINEPPFPGKWTAGQVAEHIHKSDQGMFIQLTGPVKKENRAPDQQIEAIQKVFLDFTNKLSSPSFIIPENKNYDKESILTRFIEIRGRIAESIRDADLTQTCIAFPFPGFGELTRLEIISFIIVHTQRHIYQLQKIKQAFKKSLLSQMY